MTRGKGVIDRMRAVAPARQGLSRGLLWAWPVALAWWLYATVGRLGFNPSDEGYVLAQAYRVLRGEIPHRDIISPRPLGSAFLHVVDFAIPGPLFEVSRIAALAEVIAYSVLFAALTYGRRLRDFRPVHAAGAAAAVLVNIHGFPLMAWHTIDGLLLVAAGLFLVHAAVRDRRARLLVVGAICLGAAPIVKQSFFAAPVLGVVSILSGVDARSTRMRWSLALLSAAALPGLLYLGIVSVAGGFSSMLRQLTSAQPTWGGELVRALDRPEVLASLRPRLVLLAVATAIAHAAPWLAVRWAAGAVARRSVIALGLLARLTIVALVVYVVLDGRLLYRGRWGHDLLVHLVVFVAVGSALARRIDWTGVIVGVVAWMTMLSWGNATPNLASGVVALHIVARALDVAGLSERVRSYAPAGLGLAALVFLYVIGGLVLETRRTYVYFDRPEPLLIHELGEVNAELGGIRTSYNTFAYLDQLVRCVEAHPAAHVAVLPDNPGIYPALRLDNGLPIDWMFPPEIEGSEAHILAAVQALADEPAYLVLFQTVAAFDLRRPQRLPVASERSPAFFHRHPLGSQIRRLLSGRTITCGSFVGVYRAPPARL